MSEPTPIGVPAGLLGQIEHDRGIIHDLRLTHVASLTPATSPIAAALVASDTA